MQKRVKMKTFDILMEDKQIIVINKAAGFPTQTAKSGEKDVVSALKNHLYQQNPVAGEPYVGVIHRLDQPVEGILVFAKTLFAAKELSRQIAGKDAVKEYLAVVEANENTISNESEAFAEGIHICKDYLVKDGRANLSKIGKKGDEDAKYAELSYEILKRGENHRFLVKIRLVTGRHHQIRVQMAGAGLPLLGDRKYGPEKEESTEGINLCAYKIEFIHPKTKKEIQMEIVPSNLSMLPDVDNPHFIA